jgi:vacuolar protein sorting-associated protein 26
MSSFFFSTPVDIDIVLEDTDDRQTVDVKLDKNRGEKAPLYMDGESVKGAVTIRPKDGRRLEHTGIKVQFIGLIGEENPYVLVTRSQSCESSLMLLLRDVF